MPPVPVTETGRKIKALTKLRKARIANYSQITVPQIIRLEKSTKFIFIYLLRHNFLFSMANILAKTLLYWCTFIEEYQKMCGRAMTVEDLDMGLIRVENLELFNSMIFNTDYTPKMIVKILNWN